MCPFLLSHKHDRYSVYNSRQMYGNLRIYEHLLYYQINEISEKMLSICQGSFRKKYGFQHPLIAMLKKVKKFLKKWVHLLSTIEYKWVQFIKSIWLNDSRSPVTQIPCIKYWCKCTYFDFWLSNLKQEKTKDQFAF